jgi:cytochrome c oxidase subunit 1
MVGGMVSAIMAGLHFYWPKITGRMYPETLGRLAAVILFIGFNLTFFPQFILGFLGMPRRYWQYPPEFQVLNVFSSAGATILAVGYLLPVVYLAWSLKYGKIAGANPWDAPGLEWTVQSPPLTENFPHQQIVDFEAYDFDRLGAPAEETAFSGSSENLR